MAGLAFVAGTASAAPCRVPTLGADFTDISRAMRRGRHIPDYVAGALVRRVRAKSPAAVAGLQAGDVIQAIDHDLVQSACGLKSGIAKRGCDSATLNVRRGTDTISIKVRPVDAASLPQRTIGDQQACQDGDAAACTALAKAHGETIDLLRLACDLGDPEGCYMLGLKLRDDKEVAAAYEQACDGGYSQACTNLGWIYENARGVNKDLAAAVRLYRRGCDGSACSAPNNLGCVNLGRSFRDGNGVEKNQAVATRLFRQVCSRTPVRGSSEDGATIARACSLAGTALLFGDGVQPNVAEALTLLEKGCGENDTFGCYNLGTVYDNGTGVGPDKTRAIGYYQRACDHGDEESCARLAVLKK
ncbi:MAG: PDZ domain-containing protein [Thermoanaerobaculia bacterium]